MQVTCARRTKSLDNTTAYFVERFQKATRQIPEATQKQNEKAGKFTLVERKEQDKQKEASNQFYLDFQTKNDIDWNNSDEVYGWMATIADDLNNFDARLPLNEIYSEEELSALQQKYQTERPVKGGQHVSGVPKNTAGARG